MPTSASGPRWSAFVRENGRCSGVEFADGSRVRSPVVVNVAGPHSSHVNRLAGVYDSMNIKTTSLRHETYHVPGPVDFDFTDRVSASPTTTTASTSVLSPATTS